MTSMVFADLGLAEPILDALKIEKHDTPTPIQAQAIPEVMAGRDILGLAQTGTGKTAAFTLPILHRLKDMPRQLTPKTAHVLILAPTRELAIQIGERTQAYGKNMRLKQAIILGGVSQYKQVQSVARGVDILIATPGRLLDLVNQRHLRLDQTSILVLDEADRMFDMGFIVKVRQIVALLSQKRQTLMFSATMPPDIAKLANEILSEPVRVEVTPQQVTADRIEQSLYYVDLPDKKVLLAELLTKDPAMERVIAFTRTKYAADRIATFLVKAGIKAESLHGDKTQGARQRSLEQFRNGSARVLVATDIAARGIDVSNVTHVVNYDLPNEAESYVHRIGRTARAGTTGQAISFCDASERHFLREIEKLTKQRLNVVGGDLQSLTPMPPVGARKGAKPANLNAGDDRGARRGPKPRALGQGQGQGEGQGRGAGRNAGRDHRVPTDRPQIEHVQTEYVRAEYAQAGRGQSRPEYGEERAEGRGENRGQDRARGFRDFRASSRGENRPSENRSSESRSGNRSEPRREGGESNRYREGGESNRYREGRGTDRHREGGFSQKGREGGFGDRNRDDRNREGRSDAGRGRPSQGENRGGQKPDAKRSDQRKPFHKKSAKGPQKPHAQGGQRPPQRRRNSEAA